MDQTSRREKPVLRLLLTLGGAAAAAALVWFVGPLLTLGEMRPLAGETARLAAVAGLLALGLANAGWRVAQAARHNRRLMDQLLDPGAREVAVLGERFEQAVALLKRTRIGGKRRLFAALAGRPYVYQLPWYVIIGAPGAGKTTALVHSGLEFPLAAQLGQQAVRGIGGTRNCDWWFTGEAVLIDTAGRYTTQDSNAPADRAAWLGFLSLLKQHRPRRPINGVLLTVSASDLLGAEPDKRRTHANDLRARIDELQAQLAIRVPVYVMVTKLDLLAGFMEFFADLDKDERAQVWGVTFPYAPDPSAEGPLARVASEFAALEKRLNDGLFERLPAEGDRERRAAIYAFPQQWRVLHQTLHEFLHEAFADPGVERPPLLRGVYFTSATQEGTPMDRALGSLARAMGLTGRLVAPARPSGKAFFVTRLLRNVVFGEAGLAGSRPGLERRRALAKWSLIALCACAASGAAALSVQAYFDNRSHVSELGERVAALERGTALAKATDATDLAALLLPLDALRELAPADDAAPVRWALASMGLDRREMLQAAARDSYQRSLKDAFLPRIAARLEQRLRSGDSRQVELIYEALRAYLMLFAGRNFDRAALLGYLGADWDATPPTANAAERDALRGHLEQLLAGGEVGAPAHADPQLIARARTLVGSVPLAQRAYSRIKQLDLRAEAPSISVESAAGAAAHAVFVRTDGQALTRGVPGLYTRAVYPQTFRARAHDVLRQFASEATWVLGSSATPAADASSDKRSVDEIERLYVADYVRIWSGFVDQLRLAPSANLASSAEIAGQLARPDSPLAALLGTVVRQVTLSPRSLIDARFEALQQFVDSQPSRLDQTRELLSRLSMHLTAVDDAVKRKTAAPLASDVTREMFAAAQRAPEPVRGMLAQLAGIGAAQAFVALREPLAQQLASDVTAACERAVAGRYPLARDSSQEISREDFARIFGAGGVVDGFFQRHLAPYVDSSAKPWAYRRADAAARPEPSDALLPFQRAQSIRDTLFREGGRTFGVRLEFKLIELDAGLAQFALDIDGQVLRFARDSKTALSAIWPGSGGSGRVRVAQGPVGGGAGSGYVFEGPWALFRLFDRVRVEPGAAPDRVRLLFDVEGRKARFEVRSSTPLNPLLRHDLEQFECPKRL